MRRARARQDEGASARPVRVLGGSGETMGRRQAGARGVDDANIEQNTLAFLVEESEQGE
jgi:hypothetical protein